MANEIQLNLKENLENRFVAFLDVLGFSDLVSKNNVESLESYFSKITGVLESLKEKKSKIYSLSISDSIILIAEPGLDSFRELVTAIRTIQSQLLYRKIILRGAVSYGPVFYDRERNIIVGKGYIKAYLLEAQAIYPRVIIDPAIIKLFGKDKTTFIKQVNTSIDYTFEKRLIYCKSEFSRIQDDAIFIDYANKIVMKEKLHGADLKTYQTILENLYTDQKVFSKYIWLRDYFLESFKLTHFILTNELQFNNGHTNKISKWIEKYERL